MSNPGWADWAAVQKVDPETADAILKEVERENTKIELIASENFSSPAVLAALGTPLTNKYAEGYPGRRYYGGCEYVDVVEELAIERAKALFGAEHVNVQPHAGAQANLAAYFAFLQPGDTFMGMALAHGGHLTHGSPVNFTGKLFNVVSYGVREEDELIDYDEVPRHSQARAARSSSSPGQPRTRSSGTSERSGRLRTTSVRSSLWMRLTSSASLPAVCTRTPSSTPTSSRARPTRHCGGRAGR